MGQVGRSTQPFSPGWLCFFWGKKRNPILEKNRGTIVPFWNDKTDAAISGKILNKKAFIKTNKKHTTYLDLDFITTIRFFCKDKRHRKRTQHQPTPTSHQPSEKNTSWGSWWFHPSESDVFRNPGEKTIHVGKCSSQKMGVSRFFFYV